MFVALRFSEYMNKDLSIIIHAFAAYGIYQILEKMSNLKKLLFQLSYFYLFFEIIRFVHLPWVHPYDQVAKKAEVLNSKLNRLDDIIIED